MINIEQEARKLYEQLSKVFVDKGIRGDDFSKLEKLFKLTSDNALLSHEWDKLNTNSLQKQNEELKRFPHGVSHFHRECWETMHLLDSKVDNVYDGLKYVGGGHFGDTEITMKHTAGRAINRITELKAKLGESVEALEFYGDREHWVDVNDGPHKCIFRPPVDNEYDKNDEHYPNGFTCGKTARQALAEIKEQPWKRYDLT